MVIGAGCFDDQDPLTGDYLAVAGLAKMTAVLAEEFEPLVQPLGEAVFHRWLWRQFEAVVILGPTT